MSDALFTALCGRVLLVLFSALTLAGVALHAETTRPDPPPTITVPRTFTMTFERP